MDIVGARRLLRMLTVLLLSLALAACGADDGEDEPEATTGAGEAQPTVMAETDEIDESPEMATAAADAPTSESTPEELLAATPEGDTSSTEVLTPATPEVVIPATPVASTNVVATPEASGTPTAATPAVASGDQQLATDADQNAEIEGDGTTGAEVNLAATPETTTPVIATDASPAASPAAQPSESLVVTGCDVPSVPTFQGEVTTYQVTVDVNFRSGPGAECDLALETPIGEFQQVEVIGGPVIREDDGSEWVQIEVLDTEGWVSFEFLEPVE